MTARPSFESKVGLGGAQGCCARLLCTRAWLPAPVLKGGKLERQNPRQENGKQSSRVTFPVSTQPPGELADSPLPLVAGAGDISLRVQPLTGGYTQALCWLLRLRAATGHTRGLDGSLSEQNSTYFLSDPEPTQAVHDSRVTSHRAYERSPTVAQMSTLALFLKSLPPTQHRPGIRGSGEPSTIYKVGKLRLRDAKSPESPETQKQTRVSVACRSAPSHHTSLYRASVQMAKSISLLCRPL